MRDPVGSIRKKSRFIAELRYPVTPQFIDIRGRAIAAIDPVFEKRFKHWEANEDQILFTKSASDRRDQLLIGSRRALIVLEDPDSLQIFLDSCDQFFGLVYDLIGSWLTRISRVGVRFIEVAAPEGALSYDSARTSVIDRFHKIPLSLPLEYTDSQAVLVHKYGRYAIGPTKRGDEWAKTVFGAPEEHMPEVGFAIDVDSSTTEAIIKSKNDFIAAVRSTANLSLAVEEDLLRAAGILNA